MHVYCWFLQISRRHHCRELLRESNFLHTHTHRTSVWRVWSCCCLVSWSCALIFVSHVARVLSHGNEHTKQIMCVCWNSRIWEIISSRTRKVADIYLLCWCFIACSIADDRIHFLYSGDKIMQICLCKYATKFFDLRLSLLVMVLQISFSRAMNKMYHRG